MAKRELQEINAGSMADIAFLLLIFFLVTTTMEVDAGIARTLPLKRDETIKYPPVEINDRDILYIKANSNDQLLVEDKLTEIEDLEEIVMDFYTANERTETDKTMPKYSTVDIPTCQQKIAEFQKAVEENPKDTYLNNELESWKTKLKLCQELPGNSYRELFKLAVIKLENQARTSYGLYIQIQNVLKKVVNELRAKKCEEIWNRDYYALREDDPKDQDLIMKLRVLVPERIVEAKIEK
ncbi:biopolymer transporter ExbD [Paracrocinitomix mangrovi]|uniref:ExbD/TolR family protein n=1 Tax=Paracrocinitomix mangrovi TaxID=2862509 RepID=UPI001C8DA346|nr:biopolymer transporter ExbD [Paracrocinitomix mangrovi]UKN00688.1 biopolymer transporter ExbD [Paracrocinitomix mangrovi]